MPSAAETTTYRKTPLRERFIQAYPLANSKAEAMRMAGSKAKTLAAQSTGATEILNVPEVQAAIAEKEEQIAKAADVTLDWLVEQSMSILKDADRKADKLAAVKLVAELTGNYTQKHSSSVEVVGQMSEIGRAIADCVCDECKGAVLDVLSNYLK